MAQRTMKLAQIIDTVEAIVGFVALSQVKTRVDAIIGCAIGFYRRAM